MTEQQIVPAAFITEGEQQTIPAAFIIEGRPWSFPWWTNYDPAQPAPLEVDEELWPERARIIQDFGRKWESIALCHGWTIGELYGLPRMSVGKLDQRIGFVWLLKTGDDVWQVGYIKITVKRASGEVVSYYRNSGELR